VFWKPTLALRGDVATVLVSIADALQGYKCDSQWLAELRQRDDKKEASNRSHFLYTLTGLITLCPLSACSV